MFRVFLAAVAPTTAYAVLPGQTLTYTVRATVTEAPTQNVLTLTDTLPDILSNKRITFNFDDRVS